MKSVFLILFLLLNVILLHAQSAIMKQKSEQLGGFSPCYDDRADTSREVFTRTELPAKYKGRAGLANFLTEKLSWAILNSNLKTSFFSDTVLVKFVVTGQSQFRMRDLTISETKNKVFFDNLVKAIKESACSWTPGSFSGREVDSWVALNVYYSLKREKTTISLNVGYEMAKKRSIPVD